MGPGRPGGPGRPRRRLAALPASAFHTPGAPGGGPVHPQGNGAGFQPQGAQPGFQAQDRGSHRNGGQPQGNGAGFQPQGGQNGFQAQDHGSHRNGGQPQGFAGQPGSNGEARGNAFRPAFGAPGFRPGGARPHYSTQYFPRTFNPSNRFHWRGGSWNGPRGYYYRPWFYGQVLPFGWFSSEWYIDDYYDYDLPVPPYGFEWVRNGPDALLVNIGTGMVVESVPGIFY